jgi:ribosome assembly protein YihI (activator of Der GTPase)
MDEVQMTLTEIEDRFEQISERWSSDTRLEKHRDLENLDDLLGELDDVTVVSSSVARTVDELRGRIEILMDDIEAGLNGASSVITRSVGINFWGGDDSGGVDARS